MKKYILLFFFLSCFTAHGNNDQPSLEEMVGQLIIVGFKGTGEPPLSEDMHLILEDIARGRIGGVILFEPDFITKDTRNIVSKQQLKNLTTLLQANAPIPLFICIDQEGGKVRRLLPSHGSPETPAPEIMGQEQPQDTFVHANELATYLKETGINVNFAPTVDININPKSPAIGALQRSFSQDVPTVIKHAEAFAKGLASQNIIYCFKHFPGHGNATNDSHDGFTDITNTWSEQEITPYKTLLYENMPGMVMVAHIFNQTLDPTLPVSLSKKTINGLLRQKLGWQGVIITDDLQMKAIRDTYSFKESITLALNAGVDILLIGNNLVFDPSQGHKTQEIILELIQEEKVSKKHIYEAYNRVMALKKSTIMQKKHL